MDSEKIATNHVELAISKAGHLVSHINSNDKEPSWDGDVEVYKKSGHVHAKADLILKVPVQVKGHIKPNLKKKSIKYSIQYSDLRNYLYVGGTIFFVVYFDKEDEDSDPYTEHPIAILNYLQSVKRSRTLTSTEQAEILSLIEAAQDNESIYVGAYLLLDNPVAARIHFDKLPEESQKFFESCPIYHFMPNGQPTISAPTEG